MAKIQVVFYSTYGHTFKMAEAIAAGAREVEGAEVSLLRVEETMDEGTLQAMGADQAQQAFADIEIADPHKLGEADAVIFGTPTRFGNMAGQMRNFLDRTGGLWMKGGLVGKVGSVFTSVGTQHGGHETTITSFWHTLAHHGMVIVGCPYSEPRLTNMDEITGGGPYGATTMSAGDGSRQPSENELAIARFQGKHVAQIATKMFA